jgi:hypothetical protein
MRAGSPEARSSGVGRLRKAGLPVRGSFCIQCTKAVQDQIWKSQSVGPGGGLLAGKIGLRFGDSHQPKGALQFTAPPAGPAVAGCAEIRGAVVGCAPACGTSAKERRPAARGASAKCFGDVMMGLAKRVPCEWRPRARGNAHLSSEVSQPEA